MEEIGIGVFVCIRRNVVYFSLFICLFVFLGRGGGGIIKENLPVGGVELGYVCL